MDLISTPLIFKNGISMKNRFMLAPMTNTQSHEDGRLSKAEYNWLMMRAKGGFGLVMTCAAHVQKSGQGFPGQLGMFADYQIEGHQKLTRGVRKEGALAVIQLFHAGMRSPSDLIGEAPHCPSDNEKTGARALSLEEVHQLRNDFISAAVRARESGYDGVEIHGAHGYIICQFLSATINQREDAYGGSLENRARLLKEIVIGVREKCGANFLLGVRLSPERFGMKLAEIKQLCRELVAEGQVDFLDISLWDYTKQAEGGPKDPKSLLDHFTAINFGDVKWTVAGQIRTAEDVKKILESGVDFVSIGRAAILHHDFPKKVMDNPGFKPTELPVSSEYLEKEGLSEPFIRYMNRWPDFVK